jgi:shikimate dehydrogenase
MIKAMGLVGERITHSLSTVLHQHLHEVPYALFPDTSVKDALNNPNLDAFNITAPYKHDAFLACDVLSDHARKTKAVNTIVKKDGKIYGWNTDAEAMITLFQSLPFPRSTPVVILGNGATARSVQYACEYVGFRQVVVYARQPQPGEKHFTELRLEASIVIQTTPLGHRDHQGSYPFDLTMFAQAVMMIDVVYAPILTPFLHYALRNNIPMRSGLTLLVNQAILGCLALHIPLKTTHEKTLLRSLLMDQPIYFIGMPGSGKSRLGGWFAQHLHKPFMDLDIVFFEHHGLTPAQAIVTLGEAMFREKEAEVLKNTTNKATVIATGGGVILNSDNRDYLAQHGLLIYCQPSPFPSFDQSRPLTSSQDLYHQALTMRTPLYQSLAHLTVDWHDDFLLRTKLLEEQSEHYLHHLGA